MTSKGNPRRGAALTIAPNGVLGNNPTPSPICLSIGLLRPPRIVSARLGDIPLASLKTLAVLEAPLTRFSLAGIFLRLLYQLRPNVEDINWDYDSPEWNKKEEK